MNINPDSEIYLTIDWGDGTVTSGITDAKLNTDKTYIYVTTGESVEYWYRDTFYC